MITIHLSPSQTNSSESSSEMKILRMINLAVAKCKRIVVITGAGISSSSGIPVGVIVFFSQAAFPSDSDHYTFTDRTFVPPTVSMRL